MPATPPAERLRRKRERDRAAGLVRFEDLLPADDVNEVKRLCADMRERAAKHREAQARQSEAE